MISLIAIVTLFTLLSSLIAATCDCGFSINSTDSPKHQVFTNFIETDFTQAILGGWKPQSYYVAQPYAQGPYGKNATVHNVVPTKQGLQLWVRNSSSDTVPMGEVSTERKDILYGSFRIKAKMTGINGTCAGLFWVSTSFCSHPSGLECLLNLHSITTIIKKLIWSFSHGNTRTVASSTL